MCTVVCRHGTTWDVFLLLHPPERNVGCCLCRFPNMSARQKKIPQTYQSYLKWFRVQCVSTASEVSYFFLSFFTRKTSWRKWKGAGHPTHLNLPLWPSFSSLAHRLSDLDWFNDFEMPSCWPKSCRKIFFEDGLEKPLGLEKALICGKFFLVFLVSSRLLWVFSLQELLCFGFVEKTPFFKTNRGLNSLLPNPTIGKEG